MTRECFVDALRLPGEVGIDGTYNNPAVVGPCCVQTNEVSPV